MRIESSRLIPKRSSAWIPEPFPMRTMRSLAEKPYLMRRTASAVIDKIVCFLGVFSFPAEQVAPISLKWSKMLLFPFLLLSFGAAEALVPSSQLDNLPNVTQSSEEDESLDDTSLNTAAGLDNVTSAMRATSLAVFNSSLAPNNVSAEVKYECQDRFGSNLNLVSCQSAALTIEYQLRRPCTWGPRGTAVRYDFPLPQRWVSST